VEWDENYGLGNEMLVVGVVDLYPLCKYHVGACGHSRARVRVCARVRASMYVRM
jgi:hypothetical protein